MKIYKTSRSVRCRGCGKLQPSGDTVIRLSGNQEWVHICSKCADEIGNIGEIIEEGVE